MLEEVDERETLLVVDANNDVALVVPIVPGPDDVTETLAETEVEVAVGRLVATVCQASTDAPTHLIHGSHSRISGNTAETPTSSDI
jgi:hypothetical protein